MTNLEHIQAGTRLHCCATCAQWYARDGAAYCPALDAPLTERMDSTTCSAYIQEAIEGQSVQAYFELLRKGAR